MLAMDLPNAEIIQEISNKQKLAAEVMYTDFQRSPLMRQMVQVFTMITIARSNKEADESEVVAQVNEKLDYTYFYGFTPQLEEEFDEEELQKLSTILNLDEIAKYYDKYQEIWAPVVEGLQATIGEILQSYPDKEETEDPILSITSENFQTEIVESPLPVVMDCFATWCGPCKAMAPIFAKMREKYEGSVKFVKLDVEEENPLAKSLGVSAMPTFIIFKDGGSVAQKVGAMSEEVFENWIQERLNTAL